MIIYAVQITTFSSDIYDEDYIDSYWSTKDKAENYILQRGLLDRGYPSVDIVRIIVDCKE